MIRKLFTIDLRSLALLRIAIALILLADLFVRVGDLSAHYTDDGILPREAVHVIDWHPFTKLAGRWHLSLHMLSGSSTYESVLFALAAVFAMGLLVGFRTRFMAIASWIMLISVQVRNPMIVYGGDHLLRLLLFWMLFLPAGRRWSLDALRKGKGGRVGAVSSMATAGLLLQVVIMYLFTWALKFGKPWHIDGTALYYALNIDLYAKPFGQALLAYPTLLAILTRAIYLFELIGPVLLLLSVTRVTWRMIVVASFVVLQVGMGLCMELGIFPWISVAAMIPFIPGRVWGSSKELRTCNSPAWVNGFAAISLVYIMCWNIGGLPRMPIDMPRPFRFFGDLLRLDQYWIMFAPAPLTNDGWYVFRTVDESGAEWNVFSGRREALTWEKPETVSAQFPNHRWRKYYVNMRLQENDDMLPYLAAFSCDRAYGEEHVSQLDIFWVLEETVPPGEIFERVPILRISHRCSGE